MQQSKESKDYSRLFEVTADISEVDPETGFLRLRSGSDTLDQWQDVRREFIFDRGYTAEEFLAVSAVVGQDVLMMFNELASL